MKIRRILHIDFFKTTQNVFCKNCKIINGTTHIKNGARVTSKPDLTKHSHTPVSRDINAMFPHVSLDPGQQRVLLCSIRALGQLLQRLPSKHATAVPPGDVTGFTDDFFIPG